MWLFLGLEANLIPFNADAAAAVLEFSQVLLDIYQFDSQKIVLALHNDSPNYSALDYLREPISILLFLNILLI